MLNGRKCGVRKLLAKEQKGFFLGVGRGWTGSTMTDYLLNSDQKIPGWLTKVTFQGKVETVVGLGIKSRFGIMVYSRSDAIWGLCFFSLILTGGYYYYHLHITHKEVQRKGFTAKWQ